MSHDVVRFGSSRRPRVRWPRWLPLAVAAALTAVITFAIVSHGRAHRAARPAAVMVTDVGHPLLGVTGHWEVFGRGPGVVVRIQPARGRVTRTLVPPLDSDGPVFFVVGPDQVIVHPLDFVPGYVVPDRRPARGLPGPLGHGGPEFPGPGPRFVWIRSGSIQRPSMSAIGLNGRYTAMSIRLPAGYPLPIAPDGRGFFLVESRGGIYDVRPVGLYRVTTGSVAAVGPTRWLAVECGRRGRCVNVVIDSATGARRVLPGPPVAPGGADPGVISPDGSTAAVDFSAAGTGLELLDLASGASRDLPVPVAGGAGYETMAWSPDSRWLFVAAAGGKLVAVDTRTFRARGLGIVLPPISQVAVRGTPAGTAPRSPALRDQESSVSRPAGTRVTRRNGAPGSSPRAPTG